jgi:hypothetical protein
MSRLAVLPVISEIVSGAKTDKQGKKTGKSDSATLIATPQCPN